jgi:sugar (pentulose or hexulose) kinase
LKLTFLLGIDIGTTHCKAGLFTADGRSVRICTRPMQAQRAPQGFSYYPPEEIRACLAEAVRRVVQEISPGEIAGVGIASMAETGMLVGARSGEARSPLFPWFDPCPAPQAEWMAAQDDPEQRFYKTGIYPSFKASLARLIWLQRSQPETLVSATWLSMADTAAFWLTGQMATDPSLAGRTYGFRIDTREWDRDWLRALGLPVEIFPRVLASGEQVGGVQPGAAAEFGLAAGTPVTIAGHDHVVASLAAGVTAPGAAFDSLGTAESLLGLVARPALGTAEFASGLSFGCHVLPGHLYWLGGLSTSGGSLDWLRRQLGEPAISYVELEQLIAAREPGPSGILYFPYLNGAGSPRQEPGVRAAFVGLDARHTRADLAWAVMEGVAFEVEMMRRAGASVAGQMATEIRAAGGGARVPAWMQIRADVTGCSYLGLEMDEATLLGAALLGGAAGGIFNGPLDARAGLMPGAGRSFQPDAGRHAAYQQIFEDGYLALQAPLRAFYQHATWRKHG